MPEAEAKQATNIEFVVAVAKSQQVDYIYYDKEHVVSDYDLNKKRSKNSKYFQFVMSESELQGSLPENTLEKIV